MTMQHSRSHSPACANTGSDVCCKPSSAPTMTRLSSICDWPALLEVVRSSPHTVLLVGGLQSPLGLTNDLGEDSRDVSPPESPGSHAPRRRSESSTDPFVRPERGMPSGALRGLGHVSINQSMRCHKGSRGRVLYIPVTTCFCLMSEPRGTKCGLCELRNGRWLGKRGVKRLYLDR